MDRIAEIIRNLSDADQQESSGRRWEAARLIWEEISSGKSTRQLGDEIGRSNVYVHYYFRCWELVKDVGYQTMPLFADIYYSTEVRGESYQRHKEPAAEPRDSAPRDREPRDEEPASPRDTANAWVAQAAEAVNSLETYKVAWVFLDEASVTMLGTLPGRINALLLELRANADNVQ